MNSERFNELWTQTHSKESGLMGIKAGEYASGDDRLYNFKEGARLMNCTSPETAWAYLTKHLISIQKAVHEGRYNFSWAVLQEDGTYTEGIIQKIVDARNYLFLLLCCLEDETGKRVSLGMEETEVSALREALGGEKVADWAYEAVKCRKETIAANTEKYKLREENAKLRAVAEAAEKLLQGRPPCPPCPHCDGFAPPKECICEPWDLLHGALAEAGHRAGGAGGE